MNHYIEKNLKEIHERINAACLRSGRDPKSVTLINVSKTKPLEDLMEAYRCGERIYGENKVQEITQKKPQMPEDAIFHMIGHLQRNKVKQLIPYVTMIHSVDSVRLASQIQEEAQKIQRKADILLEINVAEEESKFGLKTEQVLDTIMEIHDFPNIQIKGLMTIAPYVENPEENRKVFKKLYQLSVDIAQKNIDNVTMSVLSMGMTGDFEVAIEEGATMIRVGTGIFGAR